MQFRLSFWRHVDRSRSKITNFSSSFSFLYILVFVVHFSLLSFCFVHNSGNLRKKLLLKRGILVLIEVVLRDYIRWSVTIFYNISKIILQTHILRYYLLITFLILLGSLKKTSLTAIACRLFSNVIRKASSKKRSPTNLPWFIEKKILSKEKEGKVNSILFTLM